MLVVEINNEQQTIFLFERLGIFVGAPGHSVVSIKRSERYARQSG
jgi:hypothetical protein